MEGRNEREGGEEKTESPGRPQNQLKTLQASGRVRSAEERGGGEGRDQLSWGEGFGALLKMFVSRL